MTRTLAEAFNEQAKHCEALGSPFMARLLRMLATDWPTDTALAAKFAAWPGDIGPGGASLPLRLAGGLHALVLGGHDAALRAAYPPHTTSDAALRDAVLNALHHHADFLDHWTYSPPQTNEVRRSAALIAAAHWLAARYDMPFVLSELGASGGLNLMWDHFALDINGQRFGPATPALSLTPDWHGPLPPPNRPTVAERRGADLNPLNPANPNDALRLIAYLWPDQPDRLARTRAAIAIHNAPVDRADAIDWLAPRLASPKPGHLHLIYHTIAWQYFPAPARQRGTAMIEAAGQRATADTPLAWFAMENDGTGDGAALTLRLWPGDITRQMGRADFHGRWVNWATDA